MNGTLAPYIHEYFTQRGDELITWHRNAVPIDDYDRIKAFIETVKPDLFLHIATGPVSWIEYILCALKPFGIPFVFTSSESVYGFDQKGPFTTEDIPSPKGDYGKYKIACENIINRDYEASSYIIRLGWQIAHHTHKNNLLAFLVNEEHVKASTQWILSASFMTDTAEAIYHIVHHLKPDIYHLDGNRDNLDFYNLVGQLKEAFLLPVVLEPVDDVPRNNRLIDHRFEVKSVSDHIQEIIKKHENDH
jgi:dTDP-4-dehydrorhamnose reductase